MGTHMCSTSCTVVSKRSSSLDPPLSAPMMVIMGYSMPPPMMSSASMEVMCGHGYGYPLKRAPNSTPSRTKLAALTQRVAGAR